MKQLLLLVKPQMYCTIMCLTDINDNSKIVTANANKRYIRDKLVVSQDKKKIRCFRLFIT